MPSITTTTATEGDLEMQTPTPSKDKSIVNTTDPKHLASLASVFRLPQSELLRWPGSQSFCHYLETCFTPLLTPEYASIWRTLGRDTPASADGCWPLFRDVHAAITACGGESTIEDVWRKACGGSSDRARAPSPAAALLRTQQGPAFILVFSVLCWTTMALRPTLTWADFKGETSLMVGNQALDQGTLKIEPAVQRPIPALFRQFHRSMTISRWKHAIGEAKTTESEALEVSCLNYATLRDIASINLHWVSDLASHLDFDATRRRLSVYRFPTFCALSAIAAGEEAPPPVLEGYVLVGSLGPG